MDDTVIILPSVESNKVHIFYIGIMLRPFGKSLDLVAVEVHTKNKLILCKVDYVSDPVYPSILPLQ